MPRARSCDQQLRPRGKSWAPWFAVARRWMIVSSVRCALGPRTAMPVAMAAATQEMSTAAVGDTVGDTSGSDSIPNATEPVSPRAEMLARRAAKLAKRAAERAADAAAEAADAPVLMLESGDGPWAWRSVRYDLYGFEARSHNRFVEPLVAFPPSDEAEAPWQALHIELADTSTAQQAVGMMQHLGSVVQTAQGEWPREQYEVSRPSE